MEQKTDHTQTRRKLLAVIGVTGLAGAALPSTWQQPIINSVLLPAHAQTSMCVTDATAGGPLNGNASGASTCQAACEAEATAQSAQLCAVEETVDSAGATQCECSLDLP